MRKRLSVKTYNEALRKDALTYLERSKGASRFEFELGL
jgi:hypothetical protein